MTEEKIIEQYPNQEIRCPVHLSIGQESVAVGVCNNLKKSDRIFSNHRNHAHYLAKGGDLKKMICEIYGKKSGCCGGRGGSMHLFDNSKNIILSIPIVSSSIPLATGSALQSKLDKKKIITISFFGDGAVEEGVFHESLNFASLNKLPIIFVCENNLYSVYSHLNLRQPNRKIKKLGIAHGIKTFEIDGVNIEKLSNLVKKIIKKCRSKMEPIFLVINTYRYYEHCGVNFDNNIGYRSKSEFQKWKKKDPIELLGKKLLKKNILDEKILRKIKNDLKRKINIAFSFAKKDKLPDARNIDKFLYN